MNKVVVIGAGLAGLSGAYHLQEHAPLVFEKESSVGGICRSFQQDGFTFDVTGHLLHLKSPYTKELIQEILPDAFGQHERRSAIFSKGRTTPYPFQANTYGLPTEVVKECLMGFIESLDKDHANADNFEDWVLKTFGSGIAKHFMLPFNRKFWKTDLREVTADWVSWSIPKPTLEEVVDGALGMTNVGMGYNPRFAYPKRGGIDCLPMALARPLEAIHTDHTLESIDAGNKRLRFTNGREDTYDHLITTIPLPRLYELIQDVDEGLKHKALRLRAVSVLDINVGIDRPDVSDKHWIYFPEPDYVFTRVGFPANFSEAVVPPGTSSMYIEITHPPEEKPDVDTLYHRALDDLRSCGILSPRDSIRTRHVIDIPCAYVIFDRHRQEHLDSLIDYLVARDIHAAGRYGRWDYYSMEDSILSGKAAAEEILRTIGSARASKTS